MSHCLFRAGLVALGCAAALPASTVSYPFAREPDLPPEQWDKLVFAGDRILWALQPGSNGHGGFSFYDLSPDADGRIPPEAILETVPLSGSLSFNSLQFTGADSAVAVEHGWEWGASRGFWTSGFSLLGRDPVDADAWWVARMPGTGGADVDVLRLRLGDDPFMLSPENVAEIAEEPFLVSLEVEIVFSGPSAGDVRMYSMDTDGVRRLEDAWDFHDDDG